MEEAGGMSGMTGFEGLRNGLLTGVYTRSLVVETELENMTESPFLRS